MAQRFREVSQPLSDRQCAVYFMQYRPPALDPCLLREIQAGQGGNLHTIYIVRKYFTQ